MYIVFIHHNVPNNDNHNYYSSSALMYILQKSFNVGIYISTPMFENLIFLYSNIHYSSCFFELRLTHLNLCNKKFFGFHIMLLSCLLARITPEIRLFPLSCVKFKEKVSCIAYKIRMYPLSCVKFRGKVSRIAYNIRMFLCCLRHILVFEYYHLT